MDSSVRQLEKHGRVPVNDAVRQRILAEFTKAKEPFQQAVAGSATEAADVGRQQVVNHLQREGVDLAFRSFSPQIHKKIREHAFDASGQTMKRMVGDVMGNLAISYEEGLGIREAAGRLRSEFDQMQDYELNRVARTEINSFQNEGAYETERELGVKFHQWWGAQDERVRDTADASHVEMHGQIVKVGEPFSNGLKYPGDRDGRIEEWINCRCTEAPFLMPAGYMAPPGMDYFYEEDLMKIGEETPEQEYVSGEWEDQVRKEAEKWDTHHEAVAKEYGFSTVDEFKTACSKRMENLVSGQDVNVQVHKGALDKILTDGKFKTQFETQTSGGFLDNVTRASFEKNVFGVAKEELHNRPVYGSLGKPKLARQYGDVTIKLKDDVRKRTTFMVGDSLDTTMAGSNPIASPQPLTKPSHLAVQDSMKGNLLGWKKLDDVVAPYVETQIHGGVQTADIAKVVFRKHPGETVARKLSDQGIEWVIEEIM